MTTGLTRTAFLEKSSTLYTLPDAHSSSVGEPEKNAKSDVVRPLRTRDGLDLTIMELQALMRAHRIRPYVTRDGCRAGVWVGREVREQCPEAAQRARHLFFGKYHTDICTIFREQLEARAEYYAREYDKFWKGGSDDGK